MQIRFGGANVRMAHQSLNGPEIIPLAQKGSSKSMAHHVRMNPLFDQCLCCHPFDEAIDRFGSQVPLLVGTVLPQRLEERMLRICSILGRLQVILDGNQGFRVQRESPELLSLAMTSMTAWFR